MCKLTLICCYDNIDSVELNLISCCVKSKKQCDVYLQRGCCPDLRFLEINTKLDSGYCPLPVCIQALQLGCPKLQVWFMVFVICIFFFLLQSFFDFCQFCFKLLSKLNNLINSIFNKSLK